MTAWQVFFSWPAGGVWSNLVASLICVGVAWWRIRAKLIAHHAAQIAQAARHHREHLEQAAAHHQELMGCRDAQVP